MVSLARLSSELGFCWFWFFFFFPSANSVSCFPWNPKKAQQLKQGYLGRNEVILKAEEDLFFSDLWEGERCRLRAKTI